MEEIAASDAYERTARGRVEDILPEGVVLDRTVFFARGGGQPGDVGTLRWEGGEARVTDTFRVKGRVVHQVEREPPRVGAEVLGEIDWDRRYTLMRTHTALHSMSGIIWQHYGAKVTGGNMDPGRGRMDFELEEMSAQFGREVEERLNAALAEDHPVRVLFLSREEALADPELIRTKVNLIPEHIDPIRVVDIEGIDRQADGGTHVRSTSEVGRVRVVGTESKGKGFKRIRIELESRVATRITP